jgi:zinc transport system ATP-binding protein
MTAIDVDGLTVQFGDYGALRAIHFQIESGAFLTVLGPNGSGKSTLLKVLIGLIPATEGRVLIFDRPVQAASPDDVAYVPQIKSLDRSFPALSAELVLTGLKQHWPGRQQAEDLARAREALRRVGAGHLEGRSLSTLSGGELQRVYLARGIVRQPRLILLDEPATGVDAVGAANLYDLLAEYQDEADVTIVMVTHDLEAAYHHASDVLLLSGGQQVSCGPPREALTDECLRQAFGHIGHAHSMLIGGRPDA